MSEVDRETIENKLEIIVEGNPYSMPFEAFEIQNNDGVWVIEVQIRDDEYYGFELDFGSDTDEKDVHLMISRLYEDMLQFIWDDFVYQNVVQNGEE